MITPGCDLTVDESMSSWKGAEMFFSDANAAGPHTHITKIARKPKGVGTEFKNVADGETGMVLKLELQEGANPAELNVHRNGEQFQEYPFHTAVVLRLTSHYHNTHRVVNADAAFGSVGTTHALFTKGLLFRGVVKVATKGFSKKLLTDWGDCSGASRGSSYTCTTTHHGTPIIAIGWLAKAGMVN